MKISCPSKTFLVGEYAVIDGGAALLIATSPYFVLEDSEFIDPYQGAGGFGASGARFVLSSKEAGYSDVWEVWDKYQQSDLHGSGADVVAQWVGGITFFYPAQRKIEKINWPFENLLIPLIHTGYKIETYKHLQTLKEKNVHKLKEISLKTYDALQRKDQESFLNAIQDYAITLNNLKLVCDNSVFILEKMKNCSDILAAKGCGALGADVILAVIEKNQKKDFLDWANKEKLKIIFCDNQFARGVRIQ